MFTCGACITWLQYFIKLLFALTLLFESDCWIQDLGKKPWWVLFVLGALLTLLQLHFASPQELQEKTSKSTKLCLSKSAKYFFRFILVAVIGSGLWWQVDIYQPNLSKCKGSNRCWLWQLITAGFLLWSCQIYLWVAIFLHPLPLFNVG